jgi:hypothetical protein
MLTRSSVAPVAELVDALDSKSSSARSAGSIPARGTIAARPPLFSFAFPVLFVPLLRRDGRKWDTFVPGLPRHEVMRRVSGKDLAVGSLAVERRHLVIDPAEDRSQFGIACAVFRCDRRARLAQPVGRTMRQPCLPAPVAEPVAETVPRGPRITVVVDEEGKITLFRR